MTYEDIVKMRQLTETLWKLEHGLGEGPEAIDAGYIEERVQTYLTAGIAIPQLEAALEIARGNQP